MCFVWISEQTAIIYLYNINWLVFISETQSVYCAVRAECLNTIGDNLSVYNCKWNLMRQFSVRGLLRRVLTRLRFEEGILPPKHKSRTLDLPIYCLSRFFFWFSLWRCKSYLMEWYSHWRSTTDECCLTYEALDQRQWSTHVCMRQQSVKQCALISWFSSLWARTQLKGLKHDTIYVISLSHTSPTLNTTLSFIHASYQLHILQDRSVIVSPVVAGRPAWSKLHTTSCLQMLGTTEQTLVATATRRLVFVHPCCNVIFVSRCALSDGLCTVQCCGAIMWVRHVTLQNSHLLGSAHCIVITTLLYQTCYKVRYSVFWDFTQRKLVVIYRRFGTTYRYHLQGSRSFNLFGLLDP